jgi:hypothetical protein
MCDPKRWRERDVLECCVRVGLECQRNRLVREEQNNSSLAVPSVQIQCLWRKKKRGDRMEGRMRRRLLFDRAEEFDAEPLAVCIHDATTSTTKSAVRGKRSSDVTTNEP